jgi:tetratricopeptide (TPR) repeat protein
MTSLISIAQCRTLTHVYLLKAKSEGEITLKIYDLFQKCLSKKTISLGLLGLNRAQALSDPFAVLEVFREKKLARLVQLENRYFIPTLEECLKNIQQLISHIKPKIVCENKELEKFMCPIMYAVFKDPVIDDHGHTFERDAIEKHRKTKNECPISRQPIYSLTPNRAVQVAIEEIQKQDPIPTFNLFKKQNAQLAASSLKMAQEFIEAQEYDEALGAYAKALQYTQEWSDYQKLPLLFEQMKQKDQALLAYLYLIQYQLQGRQFPEALKTAENCRSKNPELLQFNFLLIKLYQINQQTAKAIAFALEVGEVLAKEHSQDAIPLYKQIILEDPYQLAAYPVLASLTKDPHEKAHILLKGACHAIQKKEYNLAYVFSQQAQELHPDSFIDRLVDLDLLLQEKKPIEEELLHYAVIYEKKNLFALMVKSYRMLARLQYNPTYYEKIICGYDQLQKTAKAFQWNFHWLSLLMERKEWEQAEKVALQALERSKQKTPLYEQLETIYTHWQNHKLSDLWGKLGKAYALDKQLNKAEKIYQKAFKQFNLFEHAAGLADVLIQQGKTAQGVQAYYEASSTAILENHLENLSLCVKGIKEADPKMQYLELSQRMHLLTQTRILELTSEVKSLKEKILSLELRVAAVPTRSRKPTMIPYYSGYLRTSRRNL